MMQSVAARLREWLQSSPLRDPTYRLFYFGSIATALGYTMQVMLASWLMATLTPSAFMVALVQTASAMPTLLFGLIAGAMSDIVDRRKVILVTQVMMLTTVAILGIAALGGAIGPVSLLLLTFLVGCGFTFYHPAQQASVNEFVSREELPSAIALSAVAFNVARAAGPALAGAIAAWMSSGSALLAGALLFTLMIFAVRKWRQVDHRLPGVPERLFTGVRSGLRYAWHSSAMRALLIRCLSFSISASAFWALLPVVARDSLGLGAAGFGLLSAAFGVGAVIGAWSVPGQLRRRPLGTLITLGAALWAVAVSVMAVAQLTAVAMIAACSAGMAWVWVLASISAGIQSSAPAWVRARAVSTNLVATQASLAIGSALWGALASSAGIRVALVGSSVAMLTLLALTRRLHVQLGKECDVMPPAHLPELVIAEEPQPDDGPVLIQIDYKIDPKHRKDFVRAVEAIGPTRRRNGAISWRVYRDVQDRDRFVERYVIASWAEYLRQRARMTMADAMLQDEIKQYQRADVPIRVSRLIGVGPHDGGD
jgi:MFS family permease/quinol monooxygenase YgiN